MKACKLCELFDHQQQKIGDGPGANANAGAVTNNTTTTAVTAVNNNNNNNTSSNSVSNSGSVNDKTDKANNNNKSEVQSRCSHRFGAAGGVDVLPPFGIFPPNLTDVFLAAELLRGESII